MKKIMKDSFSLKENRIVKLRNQTGLSQSAFAEKFNIPVSTLRDWEQDRRHPPEYVIDMVRQILEFEKKERPMKELERE